MNHTDLKAHFLTTGNRVARATLEKGIPPGYTGELFIEGILWWWSATGDQAARKLADREMAERYPPEKPYYRGQPFGCLPYTYAFLTGEKIYLKGLVEKARETLKQTAKDETTGCAGFLGKPGKTLIDGIQEYVALMARAGKVSEDETFFEEATEQLELHRDDLRDLETGMWSQGRGWGGKLKPDFIAPPAWSRGIGWLIRGIVESLTHVPRDSDWDARIGEILIELASDLQRWQHTSGLWHVVPHQNKSYLETTGTGFIAHHFLRSLLAGWLPAHYEESALRACRGLCDYVYKDGSILHGCSGSGPLMEVEHYTYRPAPPGEKHTVGTVLQALSMGIIYLDSKNGTLPPWHQA